MERSAFIGDGEGNVVVCDGVVGPGEGRRPAHVKEGAVDSCYHGFGRGGGTGSCWNNDHINIETTHTVHSQIEHNTCELPQPFICKGSKQTVPKIIVRGSNYDNA